MTPEQFKNSWIYKEEPLSPISAERLSRFAMQASTKEFLQIAGLPIHSAYLSFANDSDDLVYGINKLVDQYDFDFCQPSNEKWIVIGSCRDGDAIAINTEKNDEIEQLDHEDLFAPQFFNTSINTLAAFLIIYKEFEESVMNEFGHEGYRNCYFTDIQFETMRTKMSEIDERALNEKGFWKDELEILLSLREDCVNTKPR